MREMPAPPAPAFVKIAGNACAAALFFIDVRLVLRATKCCVSRAASLTALFVDSES
jgi:hypothetical protein